MRLSKVDNEISVAALYERRNPMRSAVIDRRYRRSWSTTSVALVASLLSLASIRADILTGTWKITLTPDKATVEKGEREFTDTISFAGGKFSSTALGAKGFKPAAYRGDFEEKEAEFDLEQTSESEGIALWIGEVRGGKITGRLQWKKKDGTNLFFDFTGVRASS